MGKYIVYKNTTSISLGSGRAHEIIDLLGKGKLVYLVFTSSKSDFGFDIRIDENVEKFPTISELHTINAISMNNVIWVPVFTSGEYACEFLKETPFKNKIQIRIRNDGGEDGEISSYLVIVWLEE